MVVTVADRSVTQIPVELESPLQLEPCCHTCKATDKPLRTCSSCKLMSYCSKQCQASDWERHKTEDDCVAIKKARRLLEKSEAQIRANSHIVALEAIDKFGVEGAFLGRPIPGFDQKDDRIMDLLAGRFYDFDMTSEYCDLYGDLYALVVPIAKRYNTRTLWEATLEIAVEMNRLSFMSRSDRMEHDILCVLLKLHRDDDAMSYLYYWMERQSLAPDIPVDTNLVNSIKGEWPYPVCNGIRLTDTIGKLKECDTGGRVPLPVGLLMIPLAIKLRHVSIFRSLVVTGEVFRQTDAAETLPAELKSHIVSFLTGGETGAAATINEQQLDHVDKLMEYIDKMSPDSLPSIVDPRCLPSDEEKDKTLWFDMKSVLEEHDGSAPVMETLVEIIKLCYELD